MSCLFDPIGCVQHAALAAVYSIPWWAWAIAVVVALFLAWRLGGLAGLVAAAAAVGFAFGRLPPRSTPTPKSQEEFDRQNDNSGDFTQAQVDHHPKGPVKPVSDFWKKMHDVE